MLFDSHSHVHGEKFQSDRDDALARAREEGVERILTLGVNIRESREAIDLARNEQGILAAAGIHPSDAACWDEEIANSLEELLGDPNVAVLGEIGLDYYWDKDPDVLAKQRECFRDQLAMARRLGFAVSIHCRDSNDDVLEDLESHHGEEIGGVLHCFAGTWEQAKRGLDLGFYIGVGGTSTYPKSQELRDVLVKVGVDRIVLETDAPYLAPQGLRGKRNEPAFMATTAKQVAEFMGVSFDELSEKTFQNTIKALKLNDDATGRRVNG